MTTPVRAAFVVRHAPAGDRRFVAVFAPGQPTVCEPGGAAAEVTFTLEHEDARALADGRLDPNVAFMRGQMKTAGDSGAVLRALRAGTDEGFVALRRALLADLDADDQG